MFIDTSGWFSIFDSREFHHSNALRSAPSHITHSYVIAEFVALSEARKTHRANMLHFLLKLLSDSEIEVVWVDELLTSRAVELLAGRLDKRWSLCDAVSFVVMDERKLTEALTTDHHFQQAGFIQLLDS